MNSLTELNGYASTTTLPYTDLRAPNVTFDSSSATNQSQNVNEGFPFLSSVGINITEIINASSSLPTYTIDVSLVPGTTVTWPGLPVGLSISNPSLGVYVVSGMSTLSHWTAIKQATITLPTNYFGVWSYTSSINYYSGISGNQQVAWTTAVTVNDVQFLTTPLDFVYTVNAVSNIANTPQLANLDANYPGVTWTVVGTPSTNTSIDTWTTTGTGGTFSVNATTKVFTISGTRTQVNSRLAGLQIDSNAVNVDFSLTYVASNSLNSTTDTKIQVLSSVGLLYLGSTTVGYFNEDATTTDVDGYAAVTDSIYDGSGGYTLTITPSSTSAITSMSTVGSTGTSSFNSSTKVLTITGTRTQVNNRLATLKIVTAVDWSDNFTLSYTVVTPRYDTATKIQALLCGTNDTEITNMNVSRTYVANNGNVIFNTSVPYISDLDTTEPTYTISFSVSSSLGSFSFSPTDATTSDLTFTGTRAQCDAKFGVLRFWPVAGVSANGTFTYTQLKNGVQQVSQSVALLGTEGTYSSSREIAFLAGQTYTPEVSDYLYANFELMLLGGGGGGGYAYGGGGGGQIVTVQNLSMTNTTYTITIGAGGNGATGGASQSGLQGGTTSAFGYSAAGGYGGSPTGSLTGGAGAGSFAGSGGAGGSTTGGLYGGGGGGAGGGGVDTAAAQNGSSFNISNGYGGLGGLANGYTWNGGTYGIGAYGNGGGGGSSASGTASPRGNAGRGASATGLATSGTPGWGSGGGGGSPAYSKIAGSGGSGRVIVRFYSK